MTKVVVAIDPGREKCGVAVVSLAGDVVEKFIIDVGQLPQAVQYVAEDPGYSVAVYVVGDRTGTDDIVERLAGAGVPPEAIRTVDEHRSSEIGRRRYWDDNRPRGWRRLLPLGMQVPPEPYDDYVAVELAYRYLALADVD